jgi:hypothetical protein
MYPKETPALTTGFTNAFQNLKKAVEKWPENNEIFIQKLDDISSQWFKKTNDIYSPVQHGDYCVLNHADFHFKNAMYKYQGDQLEDILLVG